MDQTIKGEREKREENMKHHLLLRFLNSLSLWSIAFIVVILAPLVLIGAFMALVVISHWRN